MIGSESHPVVHVLKAGMLYFAIVFGVGFLLGPIRILWAAPRFGPRMAELWSSLAAAAGLAIIGLAVGRRRPNRGVTAPPAMPLERGQPG